MTSPRSHLVKDGLKEQLWLGLLCVEPLGPMEATRQKAGLEDWTSAGKSSKVAGAHN